jgi:hypothetical protein
MIEFESFCFLQNHKTGCTLVETFLRAHCSEDIVRYEKHWAPPARRSGKFHFVGVREPLDTYLSLFNYGLDGRGEIFLRLNAAGLGALYEAGIGGTVSARLCVDGIGMRTARRPLPAPRDTGLAARTRRRLGFPARRAGRGRRGASV